MKIFNQRKSEPRLTVIRLNIVPLPKVLGKFLLVIKPSNSHQLIAFYITVTIIVMNKITILLKTMNFRKLLLAALPVVTVITLSLTLGVLGRDCIYYGGEIFCWN